MQLIHRFRQLISGQFLKLIPTTMKTNVNIFCFERSPPVGSPPVQDVGRRFRFERRLGGPSCGGYRLSFAFWAAIVTTWGSSCWGMGCRLHFGQPGRRPGVQRSGAWAVVYILGGSGGDVPNQTWAQAKRAGPNLAEQSPAKPS